MFVFIFINVYSLIKQFFLKGKTKPHETLSKLFCLKFILKTKKSKIP